jgi:predicted transport protein
MENLEYVKFEKLMLKDNAVYNEKWLQDRIAEDPSILGLGDIVLRDRERIQPRAGRLDLLFQDVDSDQRYEVEIQLGRTDESHIIRAIEYWDIERKRYPQYDHIAVIVAEDITSRFLNVISLFNGFIPLIAIQLNAIKYADKVSLIFTTVLDQMVLGLADEEEDEEVVDRAYWERRATPATVSIADQLLELIHNFDSGFELKYNKFYIGLAKNGRPNNFVILKPKKKFSIIELRIRKSDDIEEKVGEAGMDLIDYTKYGRYRIRLLKEDLKKNRDFIQDLLNQSYKEASI